MARNEEKKNAMLNKWLQMKSADERGVSIGGKRPYLASLAESLPDAERWRRELVREIAQKVAEIQNAGLGEARLRDLNDEINKLFREKHHWDLRVKELGGPDHTKTGGRMYDDDGKELPYSRGYRYFGAAKDLPGVRELFADTAPPKPKRNRGQLFAAINPDYYGFRDEDDGELVPVEEAAEAAARAAAIEEWKAKAAAADADRAKLLSSVSGASKVVRAGQTPQIVSAIVPPSAAQSTPSTASSTSAAAAPAASAATDATLRAHVPVLDQDAVTKLVLERKKRMIMAKYASSAQIASEEQAKQMLNIQR